MSKKKSANKSSVEILTARIASLDNKFQEHLAKAHGSKARFEELVDLLKEMEQNNAKKEEVKTIKERIAVLLEENAKAVKEASSLAERISELRDMLDILNPPEEAAEEG